MSQLSFDLDLMPTEAIDMRSVFRVRRVAFLLLAIGIGLASVSHLCQAILHLAFNRPLLEILSSDVWHWGVLTPGTLTAFLGAFLLVNRTSDREWRVCAVFLLVIQGFFLGLWVTDFLRNATQNGPRMGVRIDHWQFVLQRALGLVAMLNAGWLSWETCRTLRQNDLEPLYRLCRNAASLGLTLWVLYAVRQFDWAQPWPPRLLPRFDHSSHHLRVGAILARVVAGFAAMMLCAHACALSSKELLRLQDEARKNDPFSDNFA